MQDVTFNFQFLAFFSLEIDVANKNLAAGVQLVFGVFPDAYIIFPFLSEA